jgi:hypothetical protein
LGLQCFEIDLIRASYSIGFDGVIVHEETADSITGNIKRHSDVTFFSPVSSPGVSDDGVLMSVLGSVSDGGDGVIEVVTAFCGVKDTSSVTLEVVVGSINGDASWSRLDGGFKGGNTLGFDSSVGNSVNNSFGG